MQRAQGASRQLPATGDAGFFSTSPHVAVNKLHRLYTAKLSALRFVAICSIVWGHSLLGWDTRHFTSTRMFVLQTVMIELGRLGTVIFFIISGYFLEGKIGRLNVGQYLVYRSKSIIIPWLIFVFICVCLQFMHVFSFYQLQHARLAVVLPVIENLLSGSVFYAAYWFIPVSIISACILLATYKYTYKIWYVVLLGCITFFYCINLYTGWIDVNHTKSLLGYTFFMWVGVAFKKHIVAIHKTISGIKWGYLIGLIVLAFATSCGEGLLLKANGCKDAFASIRFTNIILSLLIFAAFLKNRSLYSFKKLKPEKYVYGVYLIHSIVLLEVIPVINGLVKAQRWVNDVALLLVLQLLFFAAVVVLSYLLSVIIKNSRLHFLTGR